MTRNPSELHSVPRTMRAWEYDRYAKAEVMVLREVDVPRPGRGQILVRVRAAALNPKDGLFRRGSFPMLSGRKFPKKLGADWVGEVVALGPGLRGARAGASADAGGAYPVTDRGRAPCSPPFSVGDRVWGCLLVFRMFEGSLAQYVVANVTECARLVTPISDEEAAGIPLAAQTSLQALRDIAAVTRGDHVLIHGASGGVGVFAIQIAKALGAHVISTSSPANFDLCRDLGADETLDYATGSFARHAPPVDTFFDAIGNQSLDEIRPSLAPRATYVTTIPDVRIALDMVRTAASRQRARLVVIRPRTADLETLDRMIQDKTLHPVIDSTFEFTHVHDAFARLESRRARGKIIVRVE